MRQGYPSCSVLGSFHYLSHTPPTSSFFAMEVAERGTEVSGSVIRREADLLLGEGLLWSYSTSRRLRWNWCIKQECSHAEGLLNGTKFVRRIEAGMPQYWCTQATYDHAIIGLINSLHVDLSLVSSRSQTLAVLRSLVFCACLWCWQS
jgi:hypothetical protein